MTQDTLFYNFVLGKLLLLLLLLIVYYKIVALDESELRNYLQTLVKNIKKYLVLHYITTIVY